MRTADATAVALAVLCVGVGESVSAQEGRLDFCREVRAEAANEASQTEALTIDGKLCSKAGSCWRLADEWWFPAALAFEARRLGLNIELPRGAVPVRVRQAFQMAARTPSSLARQCDASAVLGLSPWGRFLSCDEPLTCERARDVHREIHEASLSPPSRNRALTELLVALDDAERRGAANCAEEVLHLTDELHLRDRRVRTFLALARSGEIRPEQRLQAARDALRVDEPTLAVSFLTPVDESMLAGSQAAFLFELWARIERRRGRPDLAVRWIERALSLAPPERRTTNEAPQRPTMEQHDADPPSRERLMARGARYAVQAGDVRQAETWLGTALGTPSGKHSDELAEAALALAPHVSGPRAVRWLRDVQRTIESFPARPGSVYARTRGWSLVVGELARMALRRSRSEAIRLWESSLACWREVVRATSEGEQRGELVSRMREAVATTEPLYRAALADPSLAELAFRMSATVTGVGKVGSVGDETSAQIDAVDIHRVGDPARYLAFRIRNRRVRLVDIGDAETIDAVVNELIGALSSPSGAYVFPLERLRRLLAPLLTSVDRGTAMSVQGRLALVPFELLLDHGDVVYRTNPTREPVHVAFGRRAVVIGDPHLPGAPRARGRTRTSIRDDVFLPLPGARNEARRVAQLIGVEPILGHEATETAASAQLQALCRDHDTHAVVHIAAHGGSSGTVGRNGETALRLTPDPTSDGLLTATEIATQSTLDCVALVVLSACDSAQGPVLIGQGIHGLQHAFRRAGAERVMVSRWAVDDDVASELVVAFYRRLGRGRTPSRALREARNSVRRRHPHPHHWAPLLLLE